ncbi:MAG: hypothetical protein CMC08_09420 [Flavobacteriaceae bacterium]|nr:hypothetical protein [Flavobacteriaceae bacterium]
MISHKHRFIFIHIPKTAGTSIKNHFFPDEMLDWRIPNYELLYGWCPKSKIHLQHATSRQLFENKLVTPEQWNSYFKFTFVRNPWDRAYSDYLWIMQDRNVKGSFVQYMLEGGEFEKVFKNKDSMYNRIDHKIAQSDFFDVENGPYTLDFIGRFENLNEDILRLNKVLGISKPFEQHSKKNLKRKYHYSSFYRKREKILVEEQFRKDVVSLNYSFEDKRNCFQRCFDLL